MPHRLIKANLGLNTSFFISPKRLIVEGWLTPHFNRKTHFPISVSYNVYPSEHQKWLKLPFCMKLASWGNGP